MPPAALSGGPLRLGLRGPDIGDLVPVTLPHGVQAEAERRLGTELPPHPGPRGRVGPVKDGAKATRLEVFHSSETMGRARRPSLSAWRGSHSGWPRVGACGVSSLRRRSSGAVSLVPREGALPSRHTWLLSCHPFCQCSSGDRRTSRLPLLSHSFTGEMTIKDGTKGQKERELNCLRHRQ